MLLQVTLQQSLLLQPLPQRLHPPQRHPADRDRDASPGCITGIIPHPTSLFWGPPPRGSPGLEALGQAHQGKEQEQLHGGSSRKMCLRSRPRSLYPGSGVWPEAPIRKANCSWDGYQNALKEGGGNVKQGDPPIPGGNSGHGDVGMGGKHSRLFCGSWWECRVVCPLSPLIPC